jgi:hypothetical protein
MADPKESFRCAALHCTVTWALTDRHGKLFFVTATNHLPPQRTALVENPIFVTTVNKTVSFLRNPKGYGLNSEPVSSSLHFTYLTIHFNIIFPITIMVVTALSSLRFASFHSFVILFFSTQFLFARCSDSLFWYHSNFLAHGVSQFPIRLLRGGGGAR